MSNRAGDDDIGCGLLLLFAAIAIIWNAGYALLIAGSILIISGLTRK